MNIEFTLWLLYFTPIGVSSVYVLIPIWYGGVKKLSLGESIFLLLWAAAPAFNYALAIIARIEYHKWKESGDFLRQTRIRREHREARNKKEQS